MTKVSARERALLELVRENHELYDGPGVFDEENARVLRALAARRPALVRIKVPDAASCGKHGPPLFECFITKAGRRAVAETHA